MFNTIAQYVYQFGHDLYQIYSQFMQTTGAILAQTLPQAIMDTMIMTVVSSLLAVLLGLPLSLVLYISQKDGLWPNRVINRLLSAITDSVRAIPFIILAFYLLPVSRLVVGSGTGIKSVIFVLTISAIPFYARMAELSFRGVDKGLIEAIRAMGASRLKIITNVIIPESMSSLATGFGVMVIAIISATSLAGYLGGGGLGDMAIRFGYQRYLPEVMTAVIIVLIIMNIGVQWCADKLAYKLDRKHR